MKLSLRIVEQPLETHVIVMEQRLTASVAREFTSCVLELIANNGHDRIVVDLMGVYFIDSSGLGALVAMRKAAMGREKLILCSLRAQPMALLELTNLYNYFDIYENIQAVSKCA